MTTVVKPSQSISYAIKDYVYLFELLVLKFVIQRNHEVVLGITSGIAFATTFRNSWEEKNIKKLFLLSSSQLGKVLQRCIKLEVKLILTKT